jgi:outer membrane receptor protein involved in Fe transport
MPLRKSDLRYFSTSWCSRPSQVAVLASSLLIAGNVLAQQAPASTTPATRTAPRAPTTAEVNRGASATSASGVAGDPALVLSPFEVRPEEDNGYQATSTLAGTRLRSELKDLAASITVVTKDFMNDVNATDLTSLLVYTTGTEVGGFGGNFSDLSNPEAAGVFDDALGQASPGTRVRGLIAADRTRNYFLTDTPMDGYNIERVELSRGANSILFGLGSPAGVVNSTLIKADLRKNSTQLNAQIGSYGSYRGTLDHNHVLLPNRLSFRLASVYGKTEYPTDFAYDRKKGVTLTATYQPFRNTTIRAISEAGRSDSNRPEIRPPFDKLSWWWDAGMPVWNPTTGTGRLLGAPRAPFTATTVFNAAGTRTGNNYITANWDGLTANLPGIFYQDPNSSVLGGINIGGGRTVDGVKGFADNAILNAAGTALMAGGMLGLNSTALVERTVYQAGNPFANLYTREPMISDPSVFDFYSQMMGGPTKYEYGWWTTHNVSIEQTFLNKDLGFEVSFDKQSLDNGFTSPMRYNMNLDVNEVLPNGAPNPNFLRPVSLGSGFKRVYSQDREAFRGTGYYKWDFRKIPGPNWLSKFLGRHLLNGSYARQDHFYERLGGTLWSNDLDWRAFESQAGPGTASSTARIVPVIHYMGPSVAGTSSFAQARIQGLTANHDPSGTPTMTLLTHKRPVGATPTAPANFRPWEVQTFSMLSNGKYDVRRTVRNANGYANRTELNVQSLSFALQSHWLENTIVTTAGWRKDKVDSLDAGLPAQGPLGTAVIDPEVWYPTLTRAIEEESTNWGIVGHLPQFVARRLPFNTSLSAFYNEATNFRVAPQRFTITSEALPSETGETKEYGVRLSTFNNKLELKIARYTTVADKASVGNLAGAIGQLAAMINNVVDQNFGGLNVNNPAGIAAFENWVTSPAGLTFQQAFSQTFVDNNDPAKPRATYGRWADSGSDRGQITAVSALESTGTEIELVFNPVRNWRISASAASAEAVRTNIAPELFSFLFNSNDGLMTLVQNANGTPTAAGALIGSPSGSSNSLLAYLNGNVINNGLITTFAQEGTKTDELRKWSFRAVTNYQFGSEIFGGRLKGFNLGGAVRWSDKQLIGYAGTTINSGGQTLVISDVNRPFFGPRETIVDLSVGYKRKLTDKINWSVQLFVKNVGVGDELRPLGVWPDGRVVNWTIKEPQKWTLSNSFSF